MGRRSKITQLPREFREWLDRVIAEGNFQAYEYLTAEANTKLAAAGYTLTLSKSGLHRYGSALERRMAAIKASTEAAAAIASAAPDEADRRSEAVLSLIQTEVFDTILQLQAVEDADAGERVKLLSAAAKNIATMTRASVTLKRWQTEWRTKFAQALARIETEATTGKLTPTEVIARIRSAYGLDQPPAEPDAAAPVAPNRPPSTPQGGAAA